MISWFHPRGQVREHGPGGMVSHGHHQQIAPLGHLGNLNVSKSTRFFLWNFRVKFRKSPDPLLGRGSSPFCRVLSGPKPAPKETSRKVKHDSRDSGWDTVMRCHEISLSSIASLSWRFSVSRQRRRSRVPCFQPKSLWLHPAVKP